MCSVARGKQSALRTDGIGSHGMQTGSHELNSKILTALFPPARRRIFCALFSHPDRWWSPAELAGRTGLRLVSVQQNVACLRRGGIIRAKTIAGHQLLQPDPASPVFGELRSIVTKLSAGTPFGGRSETILVVEDQAATAQITRILLESWGYRVLEARGAREALGIFEQHGNAIVLLLADVILPEMSGPQLADELCGRNPGLRVVFMSGAASDEVIRRGGPFLSKPFNPASLSRIIRDELDQLNRLVEQQGAGSQGPGAGR
jgi:CheY-like chemotaxis protein